MVKYSVKPSAEKSAKTKGESLKVHFKNITEVAAALRTTDGKRMSVTRATAYLKNVLEQKEAIPFNTNKGGRGRHAQAKNVKAPGSLAGWPKNAAKAVLSLLQNAQANAAAKGLDEEKLVVKHISAKQAPKGRRRTYRAHGRINPYMSQPSHVELVVEEAGEKVKKAVVPTFPRTHKRKAAARGLVQEGGGVE